MTSTPNYKRYIYKVLKFVHPETGIRKTALISVNKIINDIFHRIVDQAVQQKKGKKITDSEIQLAVKLIVPGELGKHAVGEGKKAVRKYKSYTKTDLKQRVSKSKKSDLYFPVGRIIRLIKSRLRGKIQVGTTAGVYVAAVLEYVVTEILELAGNFAKKKITNQDLILAITDDKELKTFFKYI